VTNGQRLHRYYLSLDQGFREARRLREGGGSSDRKDGRERVVIVEFDSVQKAIAAHDSDAYQHALSLLGDGADRDMRIVEGLT